MDTEATGSVLLICMPWASPARPSIALGILSQMCAEANLPVKTMYPNMDIYAAIGPQAAYPFTSNRNLFGLSEHLFACDIFGAEQLGSDAFLEVCLEECSPGAVPDIGFVRQVRDTHVPNFLDRLQERVLACKPKVVGFTATFNQLMPSLALAKRLKANDPKVLIILGGASVDSEMGIEIHKAFPDTIDHVFLGEAEEAFGSFLTSLTTPSRKTAIAGTTRLNGNGAVEHSAGSPLRDMNVSPCPNYDDFFRELERVRSETGLSIQVDCLPFEGSRGCWWGAKNHCVFCGINKDLMSFREKDPARVVSEIEFLARRYRITRLMATDLIISRRHRIDIFKGLKELDLDLECFYETRADLSKKEFEVLTSAGIRKIQPGIESFSTELLYLMKKNTTRIKQVQFLRWCREYRVDATYNLIVGFPGDSVDWYSAMTEFIPRIVHLQPPRSLHRAEMHRFSPLFELRRELGVETYTARKDYLHNFPDGLLDARKVAYFFSYETPRLTPLDQYFEPLRAIFDAWKERHEADAPFYEYSLGPGFVRVVDRRKTEPIVINLSGLAADIFLFCDEIQTLTSLERKLSFNDKDHIREVCQNLLAADLLMSEGDYLLALPTGAQARTSEGLAAHIGSQ